LLTLDKSLWTIQVDTAAYSAAEEARLVPIIRASGAKVDWQFPGWRACKPPEGTAVALSLRLPLSNFLAHFPRFQRNRRQALR
jgi:hypothetical protein